MSAKYTPLATSDPGVNEMNFESIHLYDSVQDYSSNSSVEAKYSSIFSYGNPVTVSRAGGTHGMTQLSISSVDNHLFIKISSCIYATLLHVVKT